jgi:hypothetical protein
MHLRRRQLYTIIFTEALLILLVSLVLIATLMKPATSKDAATILPTESATPAPTDTPIPTVTVLPSKNATPSSNSSIYPSQVLNLTNWKETLPIGSAEKPTEVKQPVLATYKLDPWFIVQPGTRAVRFRARIV